MTKPALYSVREQRLEIMDFEATVEGILSSEIPPAVLERLLERSRFVFGVVLTCICNGAMADEPALSMEAGGVAIDAGVAGRFVLEAPQLMMRRDDYDAPKPAVTVLDPSRAVANYPDGGELKISLEGSRIRYEYGQPPADAYAFRFTMLIPIQFATDGRYAFGDSDLRPLPETAGLQFIYQGEAIPFRLAAPAGGGFSISVPKGWQELQDNRFFNWPVFCYLFTYEFKAHSGATFLEVDIGPLGKTAEASPVAFLVDRFGQSAKKTYAGKVASEDELRLDVAREAAELAAMPQADRDAYGGLPGSGKEHGLEATGFFHLGKVGERDVLVTPEGNVFFQLGVCSFQPQDDYTLIREREQVFEWLPPKEGDFAPAWLPGVDGVVSFYVANWIRKFGSFDPAKWLAYESARVRKWGFNSSAAFSGTTDFERKEPFPCTPMLPLEVWMTPDLEPMQGIDRMFDPFVPGVEEAIDRAFAAKVAPHASDPNIIGYFLGNEQLFENIPRLVPAQKSDSPSKLRLVRMLREKYAGDIGKFNAAWMPETPAASFEELNDAMLFVTTPGARRDMDEFLRLYLETYYEMVARRFHKYDRNHLLLGSRWQPGTSSNREVVEIASRHLDVVSVNYYTYAIEREFLERIHKWSGGKPLLLSEWHFTSGERGMGGHKEVADQRERGLAYRNYVENAAAVPFVIGTQWFSFADQAVTGRWFEGFNGEAANIGLVDVTDRPYRDFIMECKMSNDAIYEVVLDKRPPFQFEDRRFAAKSAGGRKALVIPRALPEMKLDGTTRNWPGRPPETLTPNNLTLGTPDPEFGASFRLCWDNEYLYVTAEVRDRTPLTNAHANADLWQGDALEIFIGGRRIDESGALDPSDQQIILGASDNPKCYLARSSSQPEGVPVFTFKNNDGYTIQAALPWKVLGIEPEDGKEFLFDIGIDAAQDAKIRSHQWIWNGTERNSSDRSGWGKARLTEN